MKTGGRPSLEMQAMQERLTKLSEASLRINENLDFNSVLQDVVDSPQPYGRTVWRHDRPRRRWEV